VLEQIQNAHNKNLILTGFQPRGTYPGPTKTARKKLYNVRMFKRIYRRKFNRVAVDVTGHHSRMHIKDDQLITAIINSANSGPQCSRREPIAYNNNCSIHTRVNHQLKTD